MRLASGEFVIVVINPKVLVKTDIHQPIVTAPTVGMDDAGDVSFSSDNGLQCGFGGSGGNFGVDASAPLEQAEHRRQRQPALVSTHVSNAAHPRLIGCLGSKTPLQHIIGQWQVWLLSVVWTNFRRHRAVSACSRISLRAR